MPAFTHSAFLQALGYAIANSLWQTALLWIVVCCINSLVKNATVKYRIALLMQFVGFCWFLFTFQHYYIQSSEALAQIDTFTKNSVQTIILTPNADSFKAKFLSALIQFEHTLPYLSLAYLLLLVVLSIRWITSYRYTKLIQTQGINKIEIDWKLFVNRIALQLNIKRKINIYISEIVQSPLTVGFFKPVILIPLASINHLSTQQMEAVILHELAHIKRWDYLINLITSAIELCLFFNPFTRLIGKIIQKEREHSCDDWVLQFQYQPTLYAEALLRIAYAQGSPAFAMNAVNNKQELLFRIKRMLNQQEKKFTYKQQLGALLLMTSLFTSLSWLQPKAIGNNNAIKQKNIPAQSVIIEPLTANINSPLVNPLFFISKPLKEEVKKATQKLHKSSLNKSIVSRLKENIPTIAIAPVVAERIENINIEKRMNAELEKANQQLQEADKQMRKKFIPFVDFEVQDLDTVSITRNLRKAIASSKMAVNTAKLQKNIEKAKADIMKLEQLNHSSYFNGTEARLVEDFVRVSDFPVHQLLQFTMPEKQKKLIDEQLMILKAKQLKLTRIKKQREKSNSIQPAVVVARRWFNTNRDARSKAMFKHPPTTLTEENDYVFSYRETESLAPNQKPNQAHVVMVKRKSPTQEAPPEKPNREKRYRTLIITQTDEHSGKISASTHATVTIKFMD